ncbi:hypothetical protein AAF712_016724 [Marasmius tenuissimus]|uniref:CUE domain-containing protein n=1 Tax=Marasmius tenuissimus TaxID=585030 RepID=A0ABR2Z543_9AGAR|nr:hypothetical protein PM082_010623 [Marasmius tenuissimus]
MASSSATSTRLFAYPSTQARKNLTPSRLATLYQTVSASLQTYLKSPNTKSSDEAVTFIRTYAQDAASQTLQNLIWAQSNTSGTRPSPSLTPAEQSIRKSTLLLAEKIAPAGGLSAQILVDLAVVYASNNAYKVKQVFEAALKKGSPAMEEVKSQLVPAFITLLSSGHTGLGLYGLRKTAHVLKSFLYSSPPEVVKLFTLSSTSDFALALARAYDHGLASIARSYGGFSVESLSRPNGSADDWHYIYLATKVDLIDSFHILMTALLSTSSGDTEKAFSVTFALLELPSSSAAPSPSEGTPFLNTSLLSDYQHSYNLLGSLQSLSTSEDPRLDILSPSLSSFDASISEKGAGALKLIIRSSGVPPGVDNRGKGRSSQATTSSANAKGKAKSDLPPEDPEIDIKITGVLDILPDHPPSYIRALLSRYDGDSEKVIGALLEGTAPSQAVLESEDSAPRTKPPDDIEEYVKSRRNVFENEDMDLTKVTFGKQKNDTPSASFLSPADNAELALLKADILRRVEEFSDSEGEEETAAPVASAAFDDESEGLLNASIKVSGDGEEDGSGSEDGDEAEDTREEAQTPEMILERAYIQNPQLFDRDMATKRSKGREDLRIRTGWDDQKIEGWKSMLERDPKKKQALIQKYEFERPQNHLSSPPGPSISHQSNSTGGRGGGGRGRGRGRGGDRGRGGGGGGNSEARDRAWKERHKSSRATRGRDKKIEKMGGAS